MSFIKIAILGLSVVTLVAVPAMADSTTVTATYAFTSDHCSGGCTPDSGGMGTITISQTAAQLLTGSVSVDVSMPAGFGFVDTGAGKGASFFFRLPAAEITYSGITAGWSIPNVLPVNQQAGGSYAGDGLMGQFQYALSCNPPGSPTGCGNGGSSPKAPPLDFTVTLLGLTVASFNDPGTSGSPFAADVISSTLNTGLIDASACVSTTGGCSLQELPPPSVPEPSSVLLLGTAGLGIVMAMKRRFGSEKQS